MKKLNLAAFEATVLNEVQLSEIKGGLSTIQVGRRQVKFSKWGEIDIRFSSNGLATSNIASGEEEEG
ncbi:MAG: hypothetical protein HUU01_12940 [Saprospiraceae bacterium]|nr:hypothetical protein [Saprospiraceae bacterium]